MLGKCHNLLGLFLDLRQPCRARFSLRADRVPLGILFMLGATVMFAVTSALSKWQVAEYSFVEVLFFRAVASLLSCAVLILPRTGLAVLRTNRLRDHLGRSATQATAQRLIIIAFGLMPLAGAVAINFSSPLFATLFAALWLNEKVGLARISALMAGFFGVLLVAAPGADSFRVGAMFALANAVLFGRVTAATRHDHNGICRNADHVSNDLSHRVFCIAAAILFRVAKHQRRYRDDR
jgi:drug/metabolite transporter (DMT)-like permease